MDNLKKQTILCVDDDKKNLELLEALLSPLGYQMKFSGSGEDALKQIEAEIPDLILLDVMMPMLSGFAVLERLRAGERTCLIPVVLLTALNAAEDKARGLKAGCDDFISKPFDKSELIARVRSLLRISACRLLLEKDDAPRGVMVGAVVCDARWVVKNVNETGYGYLGRVNLTGLNFVDFIFRDFLVSISPDEVRAFLAPYLQFEIMREGSAERPPARFLVTREVLMGEDQKIAWFLIWLQNITGAC